MTINIPRAFQSTSLSRGKTYWSDLRVPFTNLSIHFPLTREDFISGKWDSIKDFQSTSLSRGKTQLRHDHKYSTGSFNPLPSHEGRQSPTYKYATFEHFQSTSLSRGKTRNLLAHSLELFLSIHFPLTREDEIWTYFWDFISTFNPLPSHEGRPPVSWRPATYLEIFQSTSLSRGKTAKSANFLF